MTTCRELSLFQPCFPLQSQISSIDLCHAFLECNLEKNNSFPHEFFLSELILVYRSLFSLQMNRFLAACESIPPQYVSCFVSSIPKISFHPCSIPNFKDRLRSTNPNRANCAHEPLFRYFSPRINKTQGTCKKITNVMKWLERKK